MLLHAEAAAPWPEDPGHTRLGNGHVGLRVRHCTLCCYRYCYCVVACYSSTTPIRLHSNTPHRLKHRLAGWERDPGALPAGPSSARRVCRYIIVDDAGRLHNCNVLNALACSAVVSHLPSLLQRRLHPFNLPLPVLKHCRPPFETRLATRLDWPSLPVAYRALPCRQTIGLHLKHCAFLPSCPQHHSQSCNPPKPAIQPLP